MEDQQLKMEVVRLNKLDGESRTKAFCDISLGDAFIVKGFRVVEGKEGLFVSMPREPGKDGKWYTRFVPLKNEVRDELSRIVLEAYNI